MDPTPTLACVKDCLVIHFPLLRQIIMALVTAFTIPLTIKRLLGLHPHSLHELLMTYGNFLFYTFAYFYSLSPRQNNFAISLSSSLSLSSFSFPHYLLMHHLLKMITSLLLLLLLLLAVTRSFCSCFPLSYLPTPTKLSIFAGSLHHVWAALD